MYDLLIKNGQIIDPIKGVIKANIGINKGKIVDINTNDIKAKKTINAEGNFVAPGFIDIHMHEDEVFTAGKMETFESLLKMGVTSSLGGNCGTNFEIIDNYFSNIKEKDLPINFASLIGYTSLREKAGVNNRYRPVNKEELKKIKKYLEKAMNNGALGLSCGLEYTPGAATSAIMEMGEVLSKYPGSLLAAHFRFDADRSLESIAEMIIIARETGVKFQISHIGSCTSFGYTEMALDMINFAYKSNVNVMADVYPYDAFSTSIGSAVFDKGCFEKWKVGPEAILVAEGKYKGKRCNQKIFKDLRDNYPDTRVVGFVMDEDDIEKAIKHPLVMISSDAHLKNGEGHPRSAGTFPKIIKEYVKKKNSITLKEAINKMSYMPAKRLGLGEKGRIKEGFDADIIIFNYDSISDNSSYENPTKSPSGIKNVLINGKEAIREGNIVNLNCGKFLAYNK